MVLAYYVPTWRCIDDGNNWELGLGILLSLFQRNQAQLFLQHI